MRAIQQDLFGGGPVHLPQPIPIAPGRFALSDQVAFTMSRAIAASEVTRPDLINRVTALTGRRLSMSRLYGMTAPSNPDHVPNLLQAMAFDAVTGQWALLEMYAEAAGGKVIYGDDIMAYELGRAAMVKRLASQRERAVIRSAGVGR
jgi:hypothetical protein